MNEPRWSRIFLLFLILWGTISYAYHGAINPESPITGGDFRAYYRAAERLNAGEPLYVGISNYLYSPALAIVLGPVARLQFDVAVKAWFFASAASLLAAIFFYARAARFTLSDTAALGILLIVSFRNYPAVLDFGLGQADCPLVAFLCAMVLAGERGHARTAALCLAGAATIKIWAAGAGIYLILRRDWRAIPWAVGFFLLLHAIGFTIVGWKELPEYYTNLIRNHSQTELISHSIPGFARLHLTANDHVVPLSTTPWLFSLFTLCTFAAVLAALIYIYRLGPARTNHEGILRAAFAIHSLILLLPLCHVGYLLLSLPLLWTLLLSRSEDRNHLAVTIAAVALYLSFKRFWPQSDLDLQGYTPRGASWAVSGLFFTAVALWLTGFFEIWRRSRAASRISQAASLLEKPQLSSTEAMLA